MRWTYIIRQKSKVAFTITVVSLIIILINVVNTNTLKTLKSSFDSVYHDRMMVESYIFNLSESFDQKEWMWLGKNNNPNLALNEALNDSIHKDLFRYEVTYLTEEEELLFHDLQVQFSQLLDTEDELQKGLIKSSTENDMKVQYDKLGATLRSLSRIQLEESSRLLTESHRAISSTGISMKLEIIIIICVSLGIQSLLFFPSCPRQTVHIVHL